MRRRLTQLVILAPFLLSGCARPTNAVVVPHGDVARGEAARRMDRYLEGAQHFGFSGAVLVADREGVVLRKGYGLADPTRRVKPEMLFDMGSMTKQFTAAAILLLESDGRLSTRDSLARFFPDAPIDKRGITIHQMLTHTSGFFSDFADDYDHVSRDSAVRAILHSPLVAPPGSSFNYSNSGFSLLAIIVELVTGMRYEQFMQTRIFRPAGMRNTGYEIPGLDSSLVARTFTDPVDHGTPAERLARAGGPGWNLMGGGGILTTVDDLYRYDESLARGSPVSHAIQVKQFAEQFRRTPTLAHGYDWWIEPSESGGIQYNRGSDGPPLGVSGEYRKYPADSSTFILLANNRHHGWSTRRYIMPRLRRLYAGDSTLALPDVRGAAPEALGRVVGTYVVDSTAYFQVERHGDHLVLTATGQRAINVMIFNRDSNSIRNRERINERAHGVISSLRSRDTTAMRTAFGANANLGRRADWWSRQEAAMGPAQCTSVLGADRLDRGVFMSTVRVRFQNGVRTYRWAWAGSTPVINSEDGYLPGVFAFGAESPVDAGARSPHWWLSGDTLITYDLAFDSQLTALIRRDASGRAVELQFKVPRDSVKAVRGPAPAVRCY